MEDLQKEIKRLQTFNSKMEKYLERGASLVDTGAGTAIDWLVDNSADIKELLKEGD